MRGVAQRALLGASVSAAIALGASSAAASPEDIFGYGPRSMAMGATGAASATGFEAAYGNPALLSRIREQKLALGLAMANFSLHARRPTGDETVSAPPVRGVVIGADIPLPFGGVLRDRIAAGLAFYTPTDVHVRARIPYPEQPQYPLLPDRAQSLAVRLGFGFDLGYGLRVGAGLAALAEFAGTVVVKADPKGGVSSTQDNHQVAAYAPIFGVTYDLPIDEKIRVGLTYRATLDARFGITIDATKLTSLQIPLITIAGMAQYDPAQLAAEVAWERGRRVVAIGATFKRWSRYPGLIEPTIKCPDDVADCGSLQPSKIQYEDTFAVRVGVDQGIPLARTVTAHARAGAFFEGDALPRTLPTGEAFDVATRKKVEAATAYVGAPRAAFTLGGGVELARPLPPIDIDFFWQVHVLVDRNFRSVSPSGAVLSDLQARGHAIAGGVTAGVKF